MCGGLPKIISGHRVYSQRFVLRTLKFEVSGKTLTRLSHSFHTTNLVLRLSLLPNAASCAKRAPLIAKTKAIPSAILNIPENDILRSVIDNRLENNKRGY